MLVDGRDDSSHTIEWAQIRRSMDAAAHSPGAASWWRYPAIGTAPAEDRDGNYGCWPHTPRVGFHQLLGVARVQPATGWLDSAASHRAGGQSPVQRDDPLSRARRPQACHSPAQAPALLWSL